MISEQEKSMIKNGVLNSVKESIEKMRSKNKNLLISDCLKKKFKKNSETNKSGVEILLDSHLITEGLEDDLTSEEREQVFAECEELIISFFQNIIELEMDTREKMETESSKIKEIKEKLLAEDSVKAVNSLNVENDERYIPPRSIKTEGAMFKGGGPNGDVLYPNEEGLVEMEFKEGVEIPKQVKMKTDCDGLGVPFYKQKGKKIFTGCKVNKNKR